MRISDWSSDVCSSDLADGDTERVAERRGQRALGQFLKLSPVPQDRPIVGAVLDPEVVDLVNPAGRPAVHLDDVWHAIRVKHARDRARLPGSVPLYPYALRDAVPSDPMWSEQRTAHTP